MRDLLQAIFVNALALAVVSALFSGFKIYGGIETLLLAGLALTLISLVIKPVLKIATLPLNLITFGLFSFLIDAVLLYLLTLFVPQIVIVPFTFPGLSFAGVIIPSLAFNSVFAYIVCSLAIAGINTAAKWLIK